ncbi:MAG: zinc ribbon domain-containing protein [Oscillospiraceae bacterium]|nr:zinc ribbon domain-containing protein [Oscillospiraceae bacterium]
MICPACKKEISDDVRFCEYCGTPIVSDKTSVSEPAVDESSAVKPDANEPDAVETAVDEKAYISEEPAFIAEENTVVLQKAENISEYSEKPYQEAEASENNLDKIIEEALAPHSATAVQDKPDESAAPSREESGGYSEPQRAEIAESSRRVKKLNLPASIAVCVAFGILMTFFASASVALSSIRKTLVRGAVSEQIDKLNIGEIVVGDTDLANEIVDKSKLSRKSTISDVVKITLEDYEKYIIKGMFEENGVTVDDIKNMENIDLESFVGKIEGINSIGELDIEAVIENIGKFEKDEISAIVNKYSKEDFPELTFEIDKRRVEDLLSKRESPAKDYISGVVKAYENYMLTGEDTKPFTEEKLGALARESVSYILEGMNESYVEEINMEMAQVVRENKAMWNSLNPSAFFGFFGSIVPMSLSIAMIFIDLGLAVLFAAVAALVTKRINAAAITLGISLVLAGGAAIAVNAVPANLAGITGLDHQIIRETVSDLVKETFAGDFTVMGIRSLLLGVVVIGAVVAVKFIRRAVKNKKGNM